MGDVAHRIAEAMALSDHPQEPVVMQLGVQLSRPFELQTLKDATAELLRRYPRLCAALRVSEARCDFVTVPFEPRLVEDIWQHDALSLAEFRELAIDFQQAPLLRLRYRAEEGLWLKIHHALADGRAAISVLIALQDVLSGAPVSPAPTRAAPPRLPWFMRVLAFVRGVLFHGKKEPPVLLGPVKLAGTAHSFDSRIVPLGTVDALRAAAKQRFGGATINDLLVAAAHLACDESWRAQRDSGEFFGGTRRISVMVPVDLRPTEGVAEPIHNYASTYSIASLPEHRGDPARLVSHIAAQSRRLRRYHLGYAFVGALQVYDWLGALKQSRRVRLTQKLPRRAVGSGRYWRNLDTLLLTNLGRVDLPPDSLITAIEGYAPVIPPMGVSLTVGTTSHGLHVCLHASNATLDGAQSVRFLEAFVAHLATLAP